MQKVVLILLLSTCVFAAKNCHVNQFSCDTHCVDENEECLKIYDGKCWECAHWKLDKGVCTWNCSKFGESCLHCTLFGCVRCFDNAALVDGKCIECKTTEETLGGASCPRKCEDIKDWRQCVSTISLKPNCYWNYHTIYEKDECKQCPSSSLEFESPDAVACSRCGYFYNSGTFKCENFVCPEAPENCSRGYCEACKFGEDELGECKSTCSNITTLNMTECEYCYKFGANFVGGKCQNTSVIDEHGLRGRKGTIDTCVDGYLPRSYHHANGTTIWYCARKDVGVDGCLYGIGNYCLKCVDGKKLSKKGNCHVCS